MKKWYTIVAAVLAAVSVSLIVCEKSSPDCLIDANVEALARPEAGGGKECYRTFTNDPDESNIYCGTCDVLPGRARNRSVCYK